MARSTTRYKTVEDPESLIPLAQKGDEAALEELIVRYENLSLFRTYKDKSGLLAKDDFQSLAREGLWRAVKKREKGDKTPFPIAARREMTNTILENLTPLRAEMRGGGKASENENEPSTRPTKEGWDDLAEHYVSGSDGLDQVDSDLAQQIMQGYVKEVVQRLRETPSTGTQNAERILGFLLKNPGCSPTAIARAMRLGVETVQLYQRQLRVHFKEVMRGKSWGVTNETWDIFG